MAYNPLDLFPPDKKAPVANLTVFVMITFVLSFGQGDFFTSIPKYFGARSGETIAVIDGSKFTESEQREQRQRRKWANDFMELAHREATLKVDKYVRDAQGKA